MPVLIPIEYWALGKLLKYCLILAVIASVVMVIADFFQQVGFILPAVVVISIIAAWFGFQKMKAKKRWNLLMQKYGDKELVSNLINKKLWQGETAAQVLDSLGQPAAVDSFSHKENKAEFWRYSPKRDGRYGTTVTIENGVVVGLEFINS